MNVTDMGFARRTSCSSNDEVYTEGYFVFCVTIYSEGRGGGGGGGGGDAVVKMFTVYSGGHTTADMFTLYFGECAAVGMLTMSIGRRAAVFYL